MTTIEYYSSVSVAGTTAEELRWRLRWLLVLHLIRFGMVLL